jgi:hypothetical protein
MSGFPRSGLPNVRFRATRDRRVTTLGGSSEALFWPETAPWAPCAAQQRRIPPSPQPRKRSRQGTDARAWSKRSCRLRRGGHPPRVRQHLSNGWLLSPRETFSGTRSLALRLRPRLECPKNRFVRGWWDRRAAVCNPSDHGHRRVRFMAARWGPLATLNGLCRAGLQGEGQTLREQASEEADGSIKGDLNVAGSRAGAGRPFVSRRIGLGSPDSEFAYDGAGVALQPQPGDTAQGQRHDSVATPNEIAAGIDLIGHLEGAYRQGSPAPCDFQSFKDAIMEARAASEPVQQSPATRQRGNQLHVSSGALFHASV